MKPQLGDLITVSTWILSKEEMLAITPIFMITSGDNGISHNGLSLDFLDKYKQVLLGHPQEIQALINEFVMFAAECFAKKIQPGNHHDYTLSAWLANKLFYDYENGIVDAIVYPSVQQKLGMSNIAIKPNVFDRKYVLHEVKESVVIGEPDKSKRVYFLQGINETKKFDFGKRKLIWEKEDFVFGS